MASTSFHSEEKMDVICPPQRSQNARRPSKNAPPTFLMFFHAESRNPVRKSHAA